MEDNPTSNYIAVLVCDKIPNQKFWNDEDKDWTDDLEKATVYVKYAGVLQCIHFIIPDDKVLDRITHCPIEVYRRLLKEATSPSIEKAEQR